MLLPPHCHHHHLQPPPPPPPPPPLTTTPTSAYDDPYHHHHHPYHHQPYHHHPYHHSKQQPLPQAIGSFERDLKEINMGTFQLVNESFGHIRKAEDEYVDRMTSRACRFFEGYARGVAEEGFEVSDGLRTVR
jgi:hypothetical protein